MSSDNYDDEIEGEYVSGISKFVPTIVLATAIVGFISLAWYAYNAGKQSIKEDDLLVIEAEKTPMKEKPENRGGMHFPNQDKTIFETFSTSNPAKDAESVLPPPEEPIDKSIAIEAAIDKKSVNTESVNTESINIESVSTESISSESTKIEKEIVEAISVDNKKSEIPEKYKAKNSDEVTKEKIDKAPETSSEVKIQLGAFSSKKEAEKNWEKIQKKSSALANKSSIIVQANVKGKTYYRLRVVGFSGQNEAKSLCKTLSSKGQACILVSK